LIPRSKIRAVTNEEALTINETIAKLDEIRQRGMSSCNKNERQKAVHADRMLWAIQEEIAKKYYGRRYPNSEKSVPPYP
jgi:hypothetical protein